MSLAKQFDFIKLEKSIYNNWEKFDCFKPNKNIESYCIAQSFKWLKQFDKNVKVLVSYADPDVNHAGGIYQATNWIYQGCGDFQMAPTYSLRVKPDGEWIHSRTVYSVYGSADPKKLEKAIS